MEIRALQEGDDRSSFRSGDADLDRFFSRFAGQNQFRHYIGVTYVAVEGSRVLGFATVAPGHVEIDRLPAPSRRGLPSLSSWLSARYHDALRCNDDRSAQGFADGEHHRLARGAGRQ